MTGRTALVTGATGFIGSHLAEQLKADGWHVRALARRTSSRRWLPRGIEVVEADLAAATGVDRAVEGIDTVFHLAGVTKATNSSQYYAGNVRATENLLRACAAIRRVVHVSSLAAIGPSADGTPLREDAEPHPLTHYGKSKLESERVARAFANTIIVRPPVVYGPRDTDVLQMFRAAARGLLLQIGREESFFSIIYVRDLVDGIICAGERAPAGGVYFLTHPKAVSWAEFGSTAAGLLQRGNRVVHVPPPVARCIGLAAEIWSRASGKPGILSREKVVEACCRYWVCDGSRARREIGFEARTPLREGMAATLAWYREAGWLRI